MRVPQWIIEKKRDGKALSEAEITDFIQGYHLEEIPDYQMAALAMAIYLNGMTFEETAYLTYAMMNTGSILDTSGLKRPVADKHSTGGIGDKVSLILAPLVAACGLDVPMISGRGLGITGGTLDKLESIPGYRTDLSTQEMLQVIADVGCTIIGQTADLAPADKKLYALRDVTATVPSIPLITASIMCKKMAEGLDALVLDVKVGRGAFMKTREDALSLANNMVRVGEAMGKKVGALLTNMDIPLGHCIGNAVEVQESVDMLSGKVRGPLWEITRALSAVMLQLNGLANDEENANQQLEEALASGKALEIYNRMVIAQGGDPNPASLPKAKQIIPVTASQEGYIFDLDAEAFGKAVLVLGGGRTQSSDQIDHAVGITDLVQIGENVTRGQRLYTLHANDPTRQAQAQDLLANAIQISAAPPESPTLIYERILPC